MAAPALNQNSSAISVRGRSIKKRRKAAKSTSLEAQECGSKSVIIDRGVRGVHVTGKPERLEALEINHRNLITRDQTLACHPSPLRPASVQADDAPTHVVFCRLGWVNRVCANAD